MWKDYFSFSKSEQRGLITLLLIIILIFTVRWAFSRFYTPDPVDISEFEQEIVAFEKSLVEMEPKKKKYVSSSPDNEVYDTLSLFTFDPNTCSKSDFIILGLTERQAQVIENYRSKGGRFYNADDFRKIYSIPQWQADLLCPFINVENQPKTKTDFDLKQEEPVFEPTDFNPNTASKEELLSLGLSKRISSTLISYREKVDSFAVKSDLLKVYGMDSLLYQQLFAYIDLPEKQVLEEAPQDSIVSPKVFVPISLNTADTALLKTLSGIGDVFALRIVKYREKLGGYIDVRQLLEVYGMQDTRYQKIKDKVVIDTPPTKMNLNFASLKELQNHPYLNFEYARAIVKHRNKRGAFSSVDDLLTKDLLDENTFERVKPYLGV